MKALFCARYGGPEVLEVATVSRPEPKPNEIRIRVHAASLTTADTFLRSGTPYYARLFTGLLKPKHPIPGTGFAGEVEAIGAEVSRFKVGEAVFGETALGFGANAEYVCVPEDGIICPKPPALSFQEAATICDGPLTSLNFLQEIGQLKKGQHLLVNGAAGSLGTAAIQLGKYMGATVTGVCSTANVDFVNSLGADHVVDYREEDFTTHKGAYDLIFDAVGKSTFTAARSALKADGQFLSPVMQIRLLFEMLWTSLMGRQKVKFAATGLMAPPALRKLLGTLLHVIKSDHMRIVIDRQYTLNQAREAHQYIDSGHKRANIVLNLA